MDNHREEIYRGLKKKIGHTPLVKYEGEIPNHNTLWIKRECDNPYGSHYDRVYLALFKHYEELGNIKPGDKVLETTSGTAGVSFAGIGRELGYRCYVVIPEGVDQAVISKIKEQEATFYFTPEKDYIVGFPTFLREFLPKHKEEFTFLNHSMGPKRGPAYTNNEVVLSSLEEIAREVLAEINIDYFLPAAGNGSSILGIARALPKTTMVVSFESFQSAVVFDQMFPGRYEREYGIKPGTLPRHKLRGTSYQGVDFPHLRNAIIEKIIDDSVLISDREVDANYLIATGRKDSLLLPHWDIVPINGLGRSTRAGIATALELAKTLKNKNLLIIGYDKAERYDY